MSARRQPRAQLERRAIKTLAFTERVVFFIIGLLLFVAALSLLTRSAQVLYEMVTAPSQYVLFVGTRFLDVILLVLMVVELAYTVLLSLRGAVLVAEPFLIVGLIAVIRRILVITVGESNGQNGVSPSVGIGELAILTGVVLAFVASIVVLRMRPREESFDHVFED